MEKRSARLYLELFILSILGNLVFFCLSISTSESFPKPLALKDEQECFLLTKQGDIKAKNKLICHNLRLVAHIIKKYYAKVKDQEDLISIGTIGLIKAVDSFDHNKGTKFATYAAKCIENEILMHFRSLRKISREVYISEPLDLQDDTNTFSIIDMLADETLIEEMVDLKLQVEKMKLLIKKHLTSREAEVITMRYGLRNIHPMTQQEVCEKLKISRSYVSRIEKKAISTLKKYMKKI